MFGSFRIALVLSAAGVLAQQAVAQDSKAAKFTREKLLKQVIGEIEGKDVFTKVFFEDINREVETPLRFEFDAGSGVSANTRLTFKAKKITVEKLLNDLSDKYEFGWIVVANPGNNKKDGSILIRKNSKGKERGYELGKEPKTDKSSSLFLPQRDGTLCAAIQSDPRHQAAIEDYFWNLKNRPAAPDAGFTRK